MISPWKFIDSNGSFELANPQRSSSLYFPLVNEARMMSSITPLLHGDAKTGQHSFLTLPVSVDELHNTRSGRNFWVCLKNSEAWSATGNAAPQIAKYFTGQETEEVFMRAGFLWHQIIRTDTRIGLRAEITSIVPPSGDQVELMQIRLTNNSDLPVQFTPTAAIPIYGRSADNLRDHRHVTSLLHQITCVEHGVLVRPTLSFDERGHQPNPLTYAVLGAEGDGTPPQGFFPLIEDFIGEGGSLDWPEAAVRPLASIATAGDRIEGYEAMGGLRFKDQSLLPGQSCEFILVLAIFIDSQNVSDLVRSYASQEKFDYWLKQTREFWQHKLANLSR